MQPDQNIIAFPAPPPETCPFSVEHLHCPLSLRLKPKGNDISIGNIRNGTQALHLLASRPQHTPFSWTLGWRDQGVDWFYPASERVQAPNPSATFLTLLSHGILHQVHMLQSALLKITRLILLFAVPPFNPRVPSRTLTCSPA